MSEFNYEKTIQRGKAVYGGTIWDVINYVQNLLIIAGCIFLSVDFINNAEDTPTERLFISFLLMLASFLLFCMYKKLVSYKLEKFETGLSKEGNRTFIRYYLDNHDEFGLSGIDPEYMIMQRRGFGLLSPTMVTFLFFDGHILFNGQNIDRYGKRHAFISGYGILKKELKATLHNFNNTP